MRYPAQHKQQTRQRIVRAALRRFRSRGTEGASIGTLMRDLRLTHGGVYRHFRSKEELFVPAFEQVLKPVAHYGDSSVKHPPEGGGFAPLTHLYPNLLPSGHPP